MHSVFLSQFFPATFTNHFGKYGDIINAVLMMDKNTSRLRGFGFVTFANPSVVDNVIEDTHFINGKKCLASFKESVIY